MNSHRPSPTALAAALAAVVALAAGAGRARADVIPPDEDACQRMGSYLPAGTMCRVEPGGRDGTCEDATCSRLDYAGWDRDASASPPTRTFPCTKCTGPAADAGTTPPPADMGTTTPPPAADDDGCSVTPRGRDGALGGFVAASAALALVVALRRRRR